jgi:copper chaperone NosL
MCSLRFWLPGLLLCLAACTSANFQPVELSPEDMCAHCKMALSERQYAAEFITSDGTDYKFDDLGCLADYVAAHRQQVERAVFYVTDYETKRWLKAEEAYFVKSEKFRTPMQGGMVAYQQKAQAEQAAAAQQGHLLTWAEVLIGSK